MQSKILTILLICSFLCTFCNQSDLEPLIVSTNDISEIKITTAVGGGKITNNSKTTIIEKGVCWSTDTIVTIDDNKLISDSELDSFAVNITELLANTTYYVCAYITTGSETVYGKRVSFTTLGGEQGSVTDIDGNVYRTVSIGKQVWMAENLKTTKYRNGDPITFSSVTVGLHTVKWCDLTTGAYCYDEELELDTYGALYNWWAVSDNRGIAPTGWHVATIDDWKILINNLGGEYISGFKLKEAGTLHWAPPNEGAYDDYGFSALPGGIVEYAFGCGMFVVNHNGYWWSSSNYDTEEAYQISLGPLKLDKRIMVMHFDKFGGCSVRCVKD